MTTAPAEAGERFRVGAVGTGIGQVLLRLSVLAGLALAWQVAATLANDPVSWPAFTTVIRRFWDLWVADPSAWSASLLPSIARLLAGWAVAVVIGVGLGTLIGLSRPARDVIDPVAAFLRSIPPPALLPAFLALLGIDDPMKVTMIAFGVVWPILLNTADGVASVDPLQREIGRVYRIGFRDELTRIILPAAAPRIFAGLRISLSIAVILMVISEMVATVDGVGFDLVQAQRSFRSLDVWATVILLGVLGYTLNAALGAIERSVLRWRGSPPKADS